MKHLTLDYYYYIFYCLLKEQKNNSHFSFHFQMKKTAKTEHKLNAVFFATQKAYYKQ